MAQLFPNNLQAVKLKGCSGVGTISSTYPHTCQQVAHAKLFGRQRFAVGPSTYSLCNDRYLGQLQSRIGAGCIGRSIATPPHELLPENTIGRSDQFQSID